MMKMYIEINENNYLLVKNALAIYAYNLKRYAEKEKDNDYEKRARLLDDIVNEIDKAQSDEG
ncbi:MAG: hypothetical protein LIO69_07945 [Oscillospiraceae bacterium]|nr:hypothetical protein [Oscillospiraceae bacterium]